MLREHQHDRAYVSVLVGGTYTEVSQCETRLCRGMTAIFHPAGEVHADHFGEPGRCVNLELAPTVAARLAELDFAIDERCVLTDTAARSAMRFLTEADDGTGTCVDDLLVEIASAKPVSPGRSAAPLWFAAAVDEAGGALSERVSVASIAGHNGVHPTHL
ncbi:MAG: hypothetical protein M3154_04360, partial [Candidatus Eremiobacteraeota bacterium]|nr:hypothetical protein [Candidatus Eremiobacteraeota bacterium]